VARVTKNTNKASLLVINLIVKILSDPKIQDPFRSQCLKNNLVALPAVNVNLGFVGMQLQIEMRLLRCA
jgi:hypothetical protein